MCTGYLLANRELYLTTMRLLNSFRIEQFDKADCHPITGNTDPTSLVALPPRYKALFVPRNPEVLRKIVDEIDRADGSY